MTIFDFLFGKQKNTPPPPRPTMIPDDPVEPPQVTVLKTLVIVYDPVVDASTGIYGGLAPRTTPRYVSASYL